MLKEIRDISELTVSRLFSLYSESMSDLQKHFSSAAEMAQSYAAFLTEFVSSPDRLILIEEANGEWVSGLRAIQSAKGQWFLEAVETKPDCRKQGYGKMLLTDTISHLNTMGMYQITCQISKGNIPSQRLHSAVGFTATNEPSVDPWGNTDERTILYKYCRQH